MEIDKMGEYFLIAIQVPTKLEKRIIDAFKFTDDPDGNRRPNKIYQIPSSNVSVFVWEWKNAPHISDFTEMLEDYLKIDYKDYYIEVFSEYESEAEHDGAMYSMFSLKRSVLEDDSIEFYTPTVYEKDMNWTLNDEEYEKFLENKKIGRFLSNMLE